MTYEELDDALMEILKDKVDERVNKRVNERVDAEKQQITVTHISDIMKNLKFTVEQAMDALNIPKSKRSIYAGLVGKQTR